MFEVRDRVAFVTGAASGLGLAYAEVMAENGARVVLSDIDGAGAERESARLRAAGYAVEAVTLDVADLPAIRAAIDATVAKHGRLDACFANAGISAGPGPFTETGQIANVSLEAFANVVHVNLTSVFATMQAAAIHMQRQRAGRIIVTASISGLRSESVSGYAYAATKAAIINLVRHAATELAQYNVLVNAIAPGPFRTNIADGILRRRPDVVRDFEEAVPLHRIAEPDEIKGLALYLASDASSYVTGTVIPIDGGATAW
jgi:NAD(P)-dependent dehydrogenase (short-subunit alcohol dehydrogenase family)